MSFTVHDLLLRRSNGNFELVIWDERSSATTDAVTVNLERQDDYTINIYDVTSGTTPVQTLHSVRSVPLTLSNHAMIVEIIDQ